jgi:hypothetical protein
MPGENCNVFLPKTVTPSLPIYLSQHKWKSEPLKKKNHTSLNNFLNTIVPLPALFDY